MEKVTENDKLDADDKKTDPSPQLTEDTSTTTTTTTTTDVTVTVPLVLGPPGKIRGVQFWRKVLNSARYIVAPMVDQSELAWRILSRRHGAELCYSPMFHAMTFSRDSGYRHENLHTHPSDEPLIVQFCANSPQVILEAAKHAEAHCVGVDINLGCPQSIAKRGHYGAFLMSEWELIAKMVRILDINLSVPVTCKIRVFPSVEKTCHYAHMLETSGCSLLTVHGRLMEQKGIYTGLAKWAHIKAVKASLNIPVFANGNIQYMSDVRKCFIETGVDGVMTAEGNLHNPALFEETSPPVWEISEEYLQLVDQFPCPLSYIRGHLFKMWYHTFQIERYYTYRDRLAKARTVADCKNTILLLKQKCLEDKETGTIDLTTNNLPHWCCQPFIRPNPDRIKDDINSSTPAKRQRDKECRDVIDEDGNKLTLSKSKYKKFQKKQIKKSEQVTRNFRKFEKCVECGNPKGQKCAWDRCKACCKKKCYKEIQDCLGHRYQFLTRAKLKQTDNNTSDDINKRNTIITTTDSNS